MTNKPFHDALSELLIERDWSQRELARRTNKEIADWGSSAVFSQYMKRADPPSMQAMENVAKVLRIDPRHFIEYRIDLAREALNWRAGWSRMPPRPPSQRSLERLEKLARRVTD